jgi:hypothetical protein
MRPVKMRPPMISARGASLKDSKIIDNTMIILLTRLLTIWLNHPANPRRVFGTRGRNATGTQGGMT